MNGDNVSDSVMLATVAFLVMNQRKQRFISLIHGFVKPLGAPSLQSLSISFDHIMLPCFRAIVESPSKTLPFRPALCNIEIKWTMDIFISIVYS